MDETKADEIRAWLLKGSHDLQSAEWLLARPDPLSNSAGFHCQQASGTELKAYLAWHDEPLARTHSLVALIAMCLPFDTSFNTLRHAAITLTPYAVALRYPGELPELTEEEAQEALALAREVWDFVQKHLPSEIQVR